jgi:hypothetical protein
VPEGPLPVAKDRHYHRSGSWMRDAESPGLFLRIPPGVDAKGGRG